MAMLDLIFICRLEFLLEKTLADERRREAGTLLATPEQSRDPREAPRRRSATATAEREGSRARPIDRG
jgi:hypothetical protein